MAARTIHSVTLECVKGDIADQPGSDAVVNAAVVGQADSLRSVRAVRS